VLFFVSTCGVTTPGEPYVAKFQDGNGNLAQRDIPRPALISNYFAHCNVIDVHNQQRQGELGLESKWETNNCWFRLITTIVGMVVTDTWLALRCAGVLKRHDTVKTAVSLIVQQMIDNAGRVTPDKEEEEEEQGEGEGGEMQRELSGLLAESQAEISKHKLGRLSEMTGRRTQRKCVYCARWMHEDIKTAYYCVECDAPLCHGGEGQCFLHHISHGIPKRGEWKENPEHDAGECAKCSYLAEQQEKRNTPAKRAMTQQQQASRRNRLI